MCAIRSLRGQLEGKRLALGDFTGKEITILSKTFVVREDGRSIVLHEVPIPLAYHHAVLDRSRCHFFVEGFVPDAHYLRVERRIMLPQQRTYRFGEPLSQFWNYGPSFPEVEEVLLRIVLMIQEMKEDEWEEWLFLMDPAGVVEGWWKSIVEKEELLFPV